jgi:long-chain acyl-CoA synthetase
MSSIYKEKPWLKHYLSSVPAEITIPNVSINDLFDEVATKYSKHTAISFYGNKMSYKELQDKVYRFANALSELGVKKGDCVALLLLNTPEHIIAFYAVIKLGAFVSAISPVYVSSEVKHQLDDSGAEFLICQDILYEIIEKTGHNFKHIILTSVTESLPTSKKIIGKSILRGIYQKMAAPPPLITKRPNFHAFQSLLTKYKPNPPVVAINPKEDIVTLPYTGGTTGKPKGVMITHYNVIANILQWKNFVSVLEEGNEQWLSYMPFYHAGGQVGAVMQGILLGFTLVVLTTPDVDDIITAIATNKSSTFFGAPAIYEILKDHPKTDRVNWKSMKLILSGADALHEYTARDWTERTGTQILDGYGMTEVTLTAMETPLGHAVPSSVGLPICSTMAAILDPEKDDFVPVNEIGEICIIGPQVTIGYWKNIDATNACIATIEGDRWWRTGDLGRMDENGYFYIYDRKRDLIKYKGLRVYAREVEEVLKTHPKIKEVGVIGVRDLKVGENVKALIVLESDARGSVSENDIMEYCKEKMASYKIPRIIEFVGELPRTDVGKVSRRELREEEA